MKKPSKALEVLAVFAQYGPQKVSMTDIAKAAGLSRQSIYNQFGSKDAALEWAVATVLTEATQAAVDVFEQSSKDPLEVIVDAFQKWIGEHLQIWRGTPHGAEILEYVIEVAANAEVDYEGLFFTALAKFLVSTSLANDGKQAEDMTYTLGLISKGLLLKTDRAEDYRYGLDRACRVVCGTP